MLWKCFVRKGVGAPQKIDAVIMDHMEKLKHLEKSGSQMGLLMQII